MKITRSLGKCARGLAVFAAVVIFSLAAPDARADSLQATDDAFVNFHPDFRKKNYGKAGALNVAPGKATKHGYLRFDLSTLPGGATVAQAFLRLYTAKVTVAGDIDVHIVDAAWDEGTIKAKTAAPYSTLLTTISVAAADARTFIAIPLTAQLQAWLDDPGADPNFGIVLVPNPALPAKAVFNSKENVDTGHQPEIEVTLAGGGAVTSATIVDGEVATIDLADDSVTSAKIVDGEVKSVDIEDDGVTAADLAPGSVGGSEIADGSVGTNDVADGSLTGADIAPDSIFAADIAAGAIGTSEVAANSLTAADLASSSVTASELAFGAVTSTDIADGTIQGIDIANGGIGSIDIADGSLIADDLAANSVGFSEIAAGAVGLVKMNNFARGVGVNGSITVPAAAFQPDTQTTDFGRTFAGAIRPAAVSTAICVVAPVNLPHGVTVTQFEISAVDNSANNLGAFTLERIDFAAGTNQTLGQITTSGAVSGVRVFADTSITNASVSGFSYTYQITGCFTSDGSSNTNTQLYGARVRYN